MVSLPIQTNDQQMKISKELIEKFHRDECSSEEKEFVQQWLFNDDGEELVDFNETEKELHKVQMWDEIRTILPQENHPIQQQRTARFQFWKGAIAASIVFVLLISGVAIYQHNSKNSVLQWVDVENTSGIQVKYVDSKDFKLSVGPNTSAKIDQLTGIVDLAGSLLIQPKEDIELEFTGATKKMSFKKGQTYIILKGKDGKDQVIIINEKNLIDLPPIIQKQIINEFKI